MLQREHAVVAGALGEDAGRLALEDEIVQLVIGAEDFEDADASAVAAVAAAITTDGSHELVDGVGPGGIETEDGQGVAELDPVDGLRPGTRGAQAAHQTLRDDQLDGRGHEEGLHAHVDEAGVGAGRVVGVDGAEDKVAGERGANGDLGGVEVADFADHDDVGVLAQHVAQGAGEGEADLGAHLHLVDAGHLVFDRVLDRDDAQIGRVDLAEKGVERGRLARAGGTGDEDDAVRVVEHADDHGLLLGVHAQPVHGERLLLLVQEAQAHALGVDGGDGGDADVERAADGLEVDAAVLRQAALGDVEARHDLEARDDGVLEAQQIFRQRHGHKQAVDAVADAELAFLRLEVDVGGGVRDGLADDVAHEAHHGGVLVDHFIGALRILDRGEILTGILEAAGADAVMLDDELVHAVGQRQVPAEGPRGEGADPVEHHRVGRPGGGQMQLLFGVLGCGF